MKQIMETIARLKSESADSIRQQQLSTIPFYDDGMFGSQVYEYLDDGKRTLINQEREVCIKLNYIHLKYMTKRKLIHFNDSEMNIADLVENEYIYPFMIFINDRFIPWNSIKLVAKQEKYYLVIRPVNPQDHKLIAVVKTVNIITIPFNVSYWEGYSASITPSTIFAFDTNGHSTITNPYVSIVNMDDDVYFGEWVATEGINAYPIPIDKSYKVYPENVIVFKNGSPSKSSVVKLSSSLLSIDNGKNTSHDSINFKVFYNTKCNLSNDNISGVNLTFLQPQVKARNDGMAYNAQLENIEKPFELALDKNKKYEENISTAIVDVMKYNSDLLNDVYIKNSNLEIKTMTGQEAIDSAGASGVLVIPRGHNDASDFYIIVLQNGELYKYYYTHKYYADRFTVTVYGIAPTDIIELLIFKNVNNNIFDITVNANEGYLPRNRDVINSGMMMFSKESNTNYFKFPADGDQNFPVDYKLSIDSLGKTKITLDDASYYGKSLKVAYNNQFRYFWYKIVDPQNELKISLGNNFYYCPDYTKFMVFFNGRRLGTDQYRLTVPSRTTTPFYRYEIYLTVPAKTGDRLDVFYLPSLMKDVIMYPSIPVSGNIVIDKTKISYNFNKNLYMIWVNGRKVPADHIADISSTRMRIISDEHSVQTVCATKYIADIDYLTPIFKGNEALWDSIIANLSDAEIYLLLNIIGVDISDTEASIYKDSLPVASVMWELIREHYMSNPSVDIADGFVYDYQDVDSTAIEGYDPSGDAILPTADANRHDNIEPINRTYL